MQMVAPLGPVYQAGTLSGNPLAMTAGIETLKILQSPGIYERLEAKSARLEKAVAKAAKSGVGISRIASLLTIFFTAGPVIDYESATQSDTASFAKFFHSDEDIRRTSEAIERALNSSFAADKV
jgi:glutamate-1-semialdehyde 2,1-aminomutase